jgi:nicotinate-nucleotide adenylyltransferase
MLKLAVSPWKFIKVLDFELRKGRVVYTIDTIRYIRKRFGEKNRYFLLIGSDWTAGIRGWRSYAEIRKLTRIVVFPRTRNAKIPKTFLKLSCSVLAVESSAIRTGLKKRRPGLFVPPVILDYIRNHRLYQN